MSSKLTVEDIKELVPGIFKTGIALDNSDGVNMTGSGRELRWVAVRGGAPGRPWTFSEYRHIYYWHIHEVPTV